jgi:hypothetical protein
MGAVLAAYTAHNELSVRPTAYAEAAAAEQAAARVELARQREIERQEHAAGRDVGQKALHGPGRAELAAVMAAISRQIGRR